MTDDHAPSLLIENERDSLHILPLNILPLRTPGLKRAHLIKNAYLESVVELFRGRYSGSGQLFIRDLLTEFDWPDPEHNQDMTIMNKVGTLPSYDVFSLRIALRNLNIPIENESALHLSEDMNCELTSYMTDFTRPLIAQIYGDGEDLNLQTFDDVVALFRDPDVKKALEKLRIMADKLGIKPEDVPSFLEDYGDIFLSLSYYRRCLTAIEPVINDFLEAVPDLRTNYTLKYDQNFQRTLSTLENKFRDLMNQINDCFENFEHGTQNMWQDISAEKFRSLQKMIRSYHVSIGGLLCALSLKMDAWNRLFPYKGAGSPQKRAEFIMIEMRQGLDRIRHLEDPAPAHLSFK